MDGATCNLVGQSAARSEGLDTLLAALGDQPCYAVYDFEATRDDSSTLCKTVFILYSPDTCTSMQMKLALQNYKAAVNSKVKTQKEMQINDKADLTEAEFRDRFNLWACRFDRSQAKLLHLILDAACWEISN